MERPLRIYEKLLERKQKMTREEVYKLIDGERTYQDAKWDVARAKAGKPLRKDYGVVEAWIVWMEEWLGYARKAASTNIDKTEALANIRKVAALGVACMEVHETPPRIMPES
jgi:hypothetical protein